MPYRPHRYKSNLYKSGCLILLLPLLLFFIACEKAPQEPPVYDSVSVSDRVYTFHDETYHARCWVYHATNQGGISCIPDNQLEIK
jgi:hypothetical protein